MRIADIERLTELPYCAATFDCADLVVLAQRELFGRDVQLPNGRPRGLAGSAAIGELSRPYGCRTDSPQDGDMVLMIESGTKRPGHVGVFFHLAHEAWVLHTTQKTCCSVLHRVADLPDFGLRIEGYYAWLN